MQPYWKIKLSAQQPDSDMDALEIGAHPFSSDNYDFNFDLPEPPVKPIPGLLRLYSFRPHADTLFWDHTLDSEFKTNFGIPEEEKIWNFRLEIPSAAPVQFTVDSSLFPVDYGAAVHIGEFEHDIQHGNVFIYNPPSPGIVYGQLVIHNYFTSNQNTVLPEISKIAVFPNPFRDDANIRITLNKASRVQANIYNIKGQKITTLNNGLLKSGKNQFTWNCRDDNNNRVGSGIYLLKVKTGNKAQTIKMMLIK